MLTSQLITGISMIILGIFLIGLSFFTSFFILIYGIPLFILGFFILFNSKEDSIEEIKFKRR